MLGKNKSFRVLALGTAFILGVGAGLILQSKDWSVLLSSYIPALATLVAAFYGARFAFQFQEDKDNDIATRENVTNANIAIFSLSHMANCLYLYRKDIIQPVINSPARFLEMRATAEYDKNSVSLEISSLHFLLAENEGNLLGELKVSVDRYKTVLDLINTRSRHHLNQIQPLLESKGYNHETGITLEDMQEILGVVHYQTLVQETESIITHLGSALESIVKNAENLGNTIKKLYPQTKVIKFKLPD